jgi:para-nitrobenzyl esterase
MSEAPPYEVLTKAGRLSSGTGRDAAVQVFRGVPFAAPPVGPLRWTPAAEPARWEGLRPARRFAPSPVQAQPRTRTVTYQGNFADRVPLVMSEDCLYLNVWTPSLSGADRLPVIVWVHGGANRYGAGSQELYEGTRLAGRGTVIVTLNYRLGPLGFLAHPGLTAESPQDSSGNYALTDVIAALHWVQENVAAFGGDPGRVTLAGNSAGARHISHLMTSPLAHGLFSQAIGQSGAAFDAVQRPMSSLAEAEESGVRFAQSRHADTLDELRQLSAAEVALGGDAATVVDGWLLPSVTLDAFEAGKQMPVPLLLGTNADEGAVHAEAHTAESFIAAANRAQGELAPRYLEVYPAAAEEVSRSSRRSLGDGRFNWPVWKWAFTHLATSPAPVWMYRFEQAPPVPIGRDVLPPKDGGKAYGAYHTAELFYTWDNLSYQDWAWQPEDQRLAGLMADAWTHFARHGDPGIPGRLEWPALRSHPDGPVMRFGAETGLTGVPDPEAMSLQDDINAMYATKRMAREP